MFSLTTGCCSAFTGVYPSEDARMHTTVARVKQAYIADQILGIAFLIIAIIAFSGLMPLGVGIAFSVLTGVQWIVSGCLKNVVDKITPPTV